MKTNNSPRTEHALVHAHVLYAASQAKQMTTTPQYKVEFPDFELEPEVGAFLSDWKDSSWHNDASPYWMKGRIGLFVEYQRKEQREIEDARFFVYPLDEDGCNLTDFPFFTCETLAELQTWLAANVPVIGMGAFFASPVIRELQEQQKRNPFGSPAHRDAHESMKRIAAALGVDAQRYFGDYEA